MPCLARRAYPGDLADAGTGIEVFTTRPDTLFGATFMVLAPEHPLVDGLVPEGGWPEGTRHGLDRWGGDPEGGRHGVPAGRVAPAPRSSGRARARTRPACSPAAGRPTRSPAHGMPVFVADYVLMGYGTGAIMAVPGQDERDWDFATAFDLPIVRTVQPPEGHDPDTAFTGEGPAINSSNDEVSLDGLGVAEAKERITAWLQEKGLGEPTVSYKLRDWLFSRQRYWGEPFPVVFDEDGVAHGVPDSMLPVELPEVPDYSPKTYDPDDASSEPEPPLSRVDEWVHVDLDLGDGRGTRRYRRETNTMPNWAGSCWYYLRYLDPANSAALVDPENEAYWMGPRAEPVAGAPAGTRDPGGVDLYVGGVEHAVLHLLYARFWHKVLHDLGHLSVEEPFRTYFSQGYIQAAGLHATAAASTSRPRRSTRASAPTATPRSRWNGQPVTREYGKIGKSLKNMVSPDEMYAAFGADTFRLYEMGLGPLEQSKPWDTRAVVGPQRFLQRLWRNVVDEETGEVVVADAAARRRDDPRAAPHDRRGAHRLRRAGVQHGDRAAHRAQQRPDQARRRRAARGGRAARPHGRAAGAAHRRGAVDAARPRGVARARRRSRWPTRRSSSRTPSPASCRCGARCATGSRCRPTSPRTPCASWPWPAPRCRRRCPTASAPSSSARPSSSTSSPPEPQLSRPIPEPSPPHHFESPAKVKVPVWSGPLAARCPAAAPPHRTSRVVDRGCRAPRVRSLDSSA